MVNLHVSAHIRIQAVLVRAHAAYELLVAGREAEVCGRPAHIVDISFKILLLCQSLSFAYDCILATASDLPALMISNGTEAAAPEAAA